MKYPEPPKRRNNLLAGVLIGIGVVLLSYAIVVATYNDRRVTRPIEYFVNPN